MTEIASLNSDIFFLMLPFPKTFLYRGYTLQTYTHVHVGHTNICSRGVETAARSIENQSLCHFANRAINFFLSFKVELASLYN